MFIGEFAKALAESIENTDVWAMKAHTIDLGDLRIWTANGLWFIDTYPETGAFTILEKFYLHGKIKKYRRRQGANQIRKALGDSG